MVRPPRLRPGDTVAIVAPSGPVPREGFEVGCARLGERYRLLHGEGLFARDGYLAGGDERRLEELHAALQHEAVRAVLCARGGYGLMRLLPSLRLGAPRVIAGFSDITALHAASARAGVASLHAPTVTHLGALSIDHAEEVVARLESPSPPAAWRGLAAVRGGRASGVSIGGNLELVTRLLGTPWAFPLDGAVLFLEEVGERPYRIDRQLTQLELCGAASRVAAVVLGDLTRCLEPDGSGPLAEAVAAERLGRWGVPVVTGAPFGHGDRNRPFPLGARVEVDADRGTVTFLDGAVT